MSWSVSKTLPKEQVLDGLAEMQPEYEISEYAQKQLAIARGAAITVIAGGVRGEHFSISLSGHAHSEGDALDYISVNVYAVNPDNQPS